RRRPPVAGRHRRAAGVLRRESPAELVRPADARDRLLLRRPRPRRTPERGRRPRLLARDAGGRAGERRHAPGGPRPGAGDRRHRPAVRGVAAGVRPRRAEREGGQPPGGRLLRAARVRAGGGVRGVYADAGRACVTAPLRVAATLTRSAARRGYAHPLRCASRLRSPAPLRVAATRGLSAAAELGDDDYLNPEAPPVNLPSVQLVRQTAPQPTLADVPAAVRSAWLDSKLAKRIQPGMRVAVGCGSRGIKNYLAIAKATVDALKHLGARPFVVAAMGSHGGATPEGQRELLAS